MRDLVTLLDELDGANVVFRSATEPFDTSTPMGRMLVQMLGMFAQFERDTIIDRVIAGMAVGFTGIRFLPVSLTALGKHAERRGGENITHRVLRKRNGRPISYRRYDGLWNRVRENLPWAKEWEVTTYSITETVRAHVRQLFGEAVEGLCRAAPRRHSRPDPPAW
ncbi:recombinase family protein [Nocardia sp. CA-119907]|uniref:recombinase family protein n=1 Tax=Nocardia sp. CA-119907 TaxID=3239973 RepID=UPI003D970594